jgi:hypothetical protein
MTLAKNTPRLLGFMFVFVVVAGTFGGLTAESYGVTIVGPPENISGIMIEISDNPTLMQMSIVGFLIEAVGMVLLAVLLYTILEEHNKIVARWALGLWIVQAAFVAIKQISAFSLLNTSQEFVKAAATDSSYFQTLGSLFFGSTQFFYASQMVFYTIGGVLFYYLLLKSKYVPAVLSIFGIVAASLGFIGELFVFFDYNVPLYVFLPIMPFELAIGVWLMVKGIRDGSE